MPSRVGVYCVVCSYIATLPLGMLSTHIVDKTVDEVRLDYCSMNTTKGYKEEEPDEGRLVVMADTRVDPGTVVVHLCHTPAAERERERERVGLPNDF